MRAYVAIGTTVEEVVQRATKSTLGVAAMSEWMGDNATDKQWQEWNAKTLVQQMVRGARALLPVRARACFSASACA